MHCLSNILCIVIFRVWRQGKLWFGWSFWYQKRWLARISTVPPRKIWTSCIYWGWDTSRWHPEVHSPRVRQVQVSAVFLSLVMWISLSKLHSSNANFSFQESGLAGLHSVFFIQFYRQTIFGISGTSFYGPDITPTNSVKALQETPELWLQPCPFCIWMRMPVRMLLYRLIKC